MSRVPSSRSRRGGYATLALASQVYYGRELRLHEPWDVRRLLVARSGSVERLEIEPDEDVRNCEGADEVLEVWDVAAEELPAQEVVLATPIPADGPGDGDAE